jgi:hypothetical protein
MTADRLRGRSRARLGGILVGVIALVALGSAALSANHSVAALGSARDVREAQVSNGYYTCLTAQAHALVHPHDVVYLGEANLYRWVTVIKAMGGWAHMTMHLSQSTVTILLVRPTKGPSCRGDALLTIRREPHGKVLMTSAPAHAP